MATDSTRFDDRTALVTGGGSGIGREAALLFAERGARVVVADLATAGGEGTAEAIRERGGEAVFVRTDVTRADEVAAMVDTALSSFGRLDCAINSAGTATFVRTRTHEFTEEEWRRVIDVNLTGVWLCMKREIEPMLEGGGGAIVNLSSIYGLVAAAGHRRLHREQARGGGAHQDGRARLREAEDPGERPQSRVYPDRDGRGGHLEQAGDRGLDGGADPARQDGNPARDRGGGRMAVLRCRRIRERGDSPRGRGRSRPIGNRAQGREPPPVPPSRPQAARKHCGDRGRAGPRPSASHHPVASRGLEAAGALPR